jgi:hypothetical protein
MEKRKRVYSAYDKKNQARPEEVRKRVIRNKARRDALKSGVVSKGDGKDVHHVGGLKHGKKPGKTRVISASKNRSKK